MALAVLTAGAGDDVARQLAPFAALEWYGRAPALVERAGGGGVDAVVIGLDDEAGISIAPTVVALAARAPSVPVVVYAQVNGATIGKLLAVLAPGVRMQGVVRPHEPLAPAVREVLSPAFVPGVAPLLLQRFVPRAAPPLRVFVAVAALVARSRRGVEEVARWSGVSARTTERRLRRAGWPGAHTVLQSFAALDAVWLMTQYGWTARRVQQVRGFPHASSVTRLLARYVGSRPGTVREDGGFAAALEHVTLALLSPGDDD